MARQSGQTCETPPASPDHRRIDGKKNEVSQQEFYHKGDKMTKISRIHIYETDGLKGECYVFDADGSLVWCAAYSSFTNAIIDILEILRHGADPLTESWGYGRFRDMSEGERMLRIRERKCKDSLIVVKLTDDGYMLL